MAARFHLVKGGGRGKSRLEGIVAGGRAYSEQHLILKG